MTGATSKDITERPHPMADVDELADRVKRINDLTEALMKAQLDHTKAHDLAVRIGQEIAAARRQIQELPPGRT